MSLSNLQSLLKVGVIPANFNLSGKLPLVKEALTKNAKDSSLILFKILTGTLYGTEDFLTLKLPIKVQISCEVTDT